SAKSVMGQLGRAAGVAAVALGGLVIAGSIQRSMLEGRRSVEELELALRELDITSIDTAASAANVAIMMDRIQNPTMGDWITDTLLGWTGMSSTSKIMEDDFKALGDSLASLYASNPDL